MAVGVRLEFEGATQEQYDATYRRSIESHPPAGLLMHSGGPIESGWGVTDFWESREAFDRFAEKRVRPAVEESGIEALPAAPDIKEFPVHNLTRPWLLQWGSLTLGASSPAWLRARDVVARLSSQRRTSPSGPGVPPAEMPLPKATGVAEAGLIDDAAAAGARPGNARAAIEDEHAKARAQEWA